ncbi:MAG: hypothetical protein ACRDGA_02550 [Bacteroidota bacterium]
MKTLIALLLLMITPPVLHAQEVSPWRVEGGITFRHFQQQVKAEVGQPRGDRLVNEFEIGFLASGMYELHHYVALGVFLRVDRGERFAARFDGFDTDGTTKTRDAVGGQYSELWLGPFVQLRWKQLSLDLGYAPVGIRDDRARSDLPSVTGDTDGSFSLHPTIAWVISLGANVPVSESLDIILKAEYRPRYYSKRGGNPIVGNIEHGTQSIAPLIGVGWRF